jgi:hypothetical protein
MGTQIRPMASGYAVGYAVAERASGMYSVLSASLPDQGVGILASHFSIELRSVVPARSD